MAVQGNLKKFGLLKLVQLICTEKRQTALSLKHWQKEGVIYFHSGEIIHAHSGMLVGPEAVQQLLSWPEGTFKLNNYTQIPPRTVKMSWNDIVSIRMENIPAPYKANGNGTGSLLNGKINPSQEEALEHDLITLLSQLEYLQSQIHRDKNKRRADGVLTTLVEMVNQVARCAEKWLSHEKQIDTLNQALGMVGQKNPIVKKISAKNNQLEPRSILRTFNELARESKNGLQAPRQMLQGLLNLVEAHLFLLIGQFYTATLADQWRDTCQVFLVETQRVIGVESSS
ncbi:MAG: DUF4388 domain-containing protein [Chloroflexota bacterium]